MRPVVGVVGGHIPTRIIGLCWCCWSWSTLAYTAWGSGSKGGLILPASILRQLTELNQGWILTSTTPCRPRLHPSLLEGDFCSKPSHSDLKWEFTWKHFYYRRQTRAKRWSGIIADSNDAFIIFWWWTVIESDSVTLTFVAKVKVHLLKNQGKIVYNSFTIHLQSDITLFHKQALPTAATINYRLN